MKKPFKLIISLITLLGCQSVDHSDPSTDPLSKDELAAEDKSAKEKSVDSKDMI